MAASDSMKSSLSQNISDADIETLEKMKYIFHYGSRGDDWMNQVNKFKNLYNTLNTKTKNTKVEIEYVTPDPAAPENRYIRI